MKKSGILMIATILAAGIPSVSAADIDFDGANSLAPQYLLNFVNDYDAPVSCLAMICPAPEGMSVVEWDECLCRPYSNDHFFPAPVAQSHESDISAAPAAGAPFMNEQACSILDANFLVQPSREEAAGLLKPCLAALSARYGADLKLAPGEDGLNLLVGDANNPAKDLQAALRMQLKAKADGQFFGHKVTLSVPGAGVSGQCRADNCDTLASAGNMN
jgi:hypothetical protein